MELLVLVLLLVLVVLQTNLQVEALLQWWRGQLKWMEGHFPHLVPTEAGLLMEAFHMRPHLVLAEAELLLGAFQIHLGILEAWQILLALAAAEPLVEAYQFHLVLAEAEPRVEAFPFLLHWEVLCYFSLVAQMVELEKNLCSLA